MAPQLHLGDSALPDRGSAGCVPAAALQNAVLPDGQATEARINLPA
jgi:hypothetical protein